MSTGWSGAGRARGGDGGEETQMSTTPCDNQVELRNSLASSTQLGPHWKDTEGMSGSKRTVLTRGRGARVGAQESSGRGGKVGQGRKPRRKRRGNTAGTGVGVVAHICPHITSPSHIGCVKDAHFCRTSHLTHTQQNDQQHAPQPALNDPHHP